MGQLRPGSQLGEKLFPGAGRKDAKLGNFWKMDIIIITIDQSIAEMVEYDGDEILMDDYTGLSYLDVLTISKDQEL